MIAHTRANVKKYSKPFFLKIWAPLVFLIFNAIMARICAKVKKILNISTKGEKAMKIYDYNGSKNICGTRVREARKKLKLSQENLAAKLQLEGVIIERTVSAELRSARGS